MRRMPAVTAMSIAESVSSDSERPSRRSSGKKDVPNPIVGNLNEGLFALTGSSLRDRCPMRRQLRDLDMAAPNDCSVDKL